MSGRRPIRNSGLSQSAPRRGRGIASQLFMEACAWRKTHGSLARFVGVQLEVVADFLDIGLDVARRIWQALIDKGMAIGTALGAELRAWAERQTTTARAAGVSAGALRTRRWRERRASPSGVGFADAMPPARTSRLGLPPASRKRRAVALPPFAVTGDAPPDTPLKAGLTSGGRPPE